MDSMSVAEIANESVVEIESMLNGESQHPRTATRRIT